MNVPGLPTIRLKVALVTTNILCKIYLTPREGLFYMKTVPRIGRVLYTSCSSPQPYAYKKGWDQGC